MHELISGWNFQPAEREQNHLSYFPPCAQAVELYRRTGPHNRGRSLSLDADQVGLQAILRQHGFSVPSLNEVEVYNPSLTFNVRGVAHIVGRVEGSAKNAEHESVSVIFKQVGEKWIPLPSPTFELQDFRVTWIRGQMLGAGVETKPNPTHKGWVDYRMAFYTGKDIQSLTHAFDGPWGMKGVNVAELSDHQLGIYTRPQGMVGGAGQIGFTIVDSFDELARDSVNIMANAPLLGTRFPDGEWGGVNQVLPLADGRNFVVGHRAYRDEHGKRHYYPWAFGHDPYTGEVFDIGILAERRDFPSGRAKAPDLEDVLYTVGIVKVNGQWQLLTGISDTQAGMIELNRNLVFRKAA